MKRRAQEEYQAVYDNIKKKQVQYTRALYAEDTSDPAMRTR